MSSANLEGRNQSSSEGKWPAIILAFLGAALSVSAFFILTTNVGMSKVTAFYWVGISVGIGLSLLSLAVSLLINRRRAQRERDLFASSLDTLPIARQIVSPDGKVVFTSTAFRQMFPSVDKPVKTTLAAQLVGEPDEADRLARLEAQAAVGIAGHAEVTVRMANGGVEWRDVSASPLQLLPGYVVWGVEDVTPRRQVEALIRREQERFADLVERAPIGFYSVDETGRFQFINATLSFWLGVPRADVAAGRVYLQDLLAPPVAPDTPPYSPFAGEVTGGEVTSPRSRGQDAPRLYPAGGGAQRFRLRPAHPVGGARSRPRTRARSGAALVGAALPAVLCRGADRHRADRPGRPRAGMQRRTSAPWSACSPAICVGFEFLGFIDEQDRPAVTTRLSAANASGPGTPVDVSLKSAAAAQIDSLYISPRHRCWRDRRLDRPLHRHHRAEEPGSAVRAVAEDAGGRPARRRHRARLQQPADRDDRLLRPAAAAPPRRRPVLRRHHADQAERQPRRQPGAPAAGLLAPADAAAAGARHHRRAGRTLAPAAPPDRREHRAEDDPRPRPVAWSASIRASSSR